MKIGNREFETENKCYIMGILNVTPDSFSDGGKYNTMDAALRHVDEMVRQGADIVDIGGESTRPGFQSVEEEEELERVIPVIEAVKKRFDVPISLDTYRPSTAKAGIQAGVDLINDIWGLRFDPQMAEVIADSGVACCLMHNRKDTDYRNFITDVIDDLKRTLTLAKEAGILKDRIILDPGVGFAKTYEQNLEVMAKLGALKELGYPILLGTSRKSVIGLTLDQAPAGERLEGTLATTVYAVMQGCMFVRVHDIAENKKVIRMTEAILHAGV